jgi:hypothetical protein
MIRLVKWRHKMEISQKVFDEMVEEAIDDLRKSGLSNDEVFLIIRDQFGSRYLNKLRGEAIAS